MSRTKISGLIKCKVIGCKIKFAPKTPKHRACCFQHAEKLVADDKEKQQRIALRAERLRHNQQKESQKTRQKWLEECEKAFNDYRRTLGIIEGLGCISCGSLTSYPRWQAGHFISVGANRSLRFTEDNVHLQCVQCNMHQAGNHGPYRGALIAKIGIKKVEALEGPHEPAKWTIDELKAIKAEYMVKLKQLKKSAI